MFADFTGTVWIGTPIGNRTSYVRPWTYDVLSLGRFPTSSSLGWRRIGGWKIQHRSASEHFASNSIEADNRTECLVEREGMGAQHPEGRNDGETGNNAGGEIGCACHRADGEGQPAADIECGASPCDSLGTRDPERDGESRKENKGNISVAGRRQALGNARTPDLDRRPRHVESEHRPDAHAH